MAASRDDLPGYGVRTECFWLPIIGQPKAFRARRDVSLSIFFFLLFSYLI
jgi:hypothetical protein